MRGEELDADDAWETLRGYGGRHLVGDSFARFRYGDGFSHARALGLAIALSVIPLVIALVGLSGTLGPEGLGQVMRRALLTLTPGTSAEVVEETLAASAETPEPGGELALWLGLVTAVAALTVAMAQVERGANRIYGIERDRPTRDKYARAAAHAAAAGVPGGVGFLLVVAGGAVGDALQQLYGIDATLVSVLRWPVGILLTLGAVTVLLRRAPHRRQPAWSWLAVGAGVALVLWLAFTGLLLLYIRTSDAFGTVYGPLTAVIALLLWAQLTSLALLFGTAFAAQLEAVRAGVHEPARSDAELAAGR